MSSLGVVEKSAAEVERADIAYTQWLSENDRLNSVTAFVVGDNTPDNPLDVYAALGELNTHAIVMVLGGVNGCDYKVIIQATAESTRLKEVCLDVFVREVCA